MGFAPTTKNGYNMFEMSSMIQKAIRRCDIPHAAYAANELSLGFRNYLWKRLYTVSAEDCYGIITKEIVALKQADDFVNKGKKKGETNDLFIAKALVLLCMARKNRDADYVACNFIWSDKLLTDEEFEQFVDYKQVEKLQMDKGQSVPDYVFDVHTSVGRRNGATRMDFFREENECLNPRQMNLFDFGDFGAHYDRVRTKGLMKPSDEARLKVFQAGKAGPDPTHNGTVWTPDTYEPYMK